MKTNKDIIFPYYSGNIKFTKVIGHINLDRFIFAHKHPKPETIKIMKQVEIASNLKLFKLKRKLKHKIYSFTPSVYIHKNNKRIYDNVISWTGLMQLDFDKIESVEVAIDLKKYIFSQQETICCFLSPSKTGVKALILIKTPEDKQHYKAIHKAVTNKYETIDYFDTATNNAILPLFLSVDINILFRDISNCIAFSQEDWSITNYKSLNENKPIENKFDNTYYENKTLRILRNKIESINTDGHTQVRSACLILGSRVAAGYIDKQTAEIEITNLIQQNNYLKKGTKGYISTALWCINEGLKQPKYYD